MCVCVCVCVCVYHQNSVLKVCEKYRKEAIYIIIKYYYYFHFILLYYMLYIYLCQVFHTFLVILIIIYMLNYSHLKRKLFLFE